MNKTLILVCMSFCANILGTDEVAVPFVRGVQIDEDLNVGDPAVVKIRYNATEDSDIPGVATLATSDDLNAPVIAFRGSEGTISCFGQIKALLGIDSRTVESLKDEYKLTYYNGKWSNSPLNEDSSGATVYFTSSMDKPNIFLKLTIRGVNQVEIDQVLTKNAILDQDEVRLLKSEFLAFLDHIRFKEFTRPYMGDPSLVTGYDYDTSRPGVAFIKVTKFSLLRRIYALLKLP